MKLLRTTAFASLLLALVPTFTGCADSTAVETSSADVTEANMTYGQLAAERIPALMAEVNAELMTIDDNTLPHEVKLLRKKVGLVRLYIDVFAFSYKKGDPDRYDKVRDDLDDGYEALGKFKDLFDAQGLALDTADLDAVEYDEAEMEERRVAVMDFLDDWLDEDLDKYTAYISDPHPVKLYDRKAKDLSRFVWGGSGNEPDAQRTGFENIGHLAGGLLKVAEDEFETMDEVDDLTDVEGHETFHDFRKRVRTVNKLVALFPEIVAPEDGDADAAAEVIADLDTLVDEFGSLNDKLLAYEGMVHDGDENSDEAEALADEMADDWKGLQDWMKDNDVHDAFDALRDVLLT